MQDRTILSASHTCILVTSLLLAAAVHAAEPTQDFALSEGDSVSIGAIVLKASGGFRGYKKGSDDQGHSLVLVREGASRSEYAIVVLDIKTNAASQVETARTFRDAYAYVNLGLEVDALLKSDWSQDAPMLPENKWTAKGIDFYYSTLSGTGENANRRRALVYATVGNDLVRFDLQTPVSMSTAAIDGLSSLVSSVDMVARER